MQSGDESTLLERAKEYDAAALGDLYGRYASKIHTYIYCHVGNEDLAADLTANVFIKMLDAIKSSKMWQLSFSGWLYRIAHNAIVDHYRRNEPQKSLPLDERLPSTTDDPVATVESIISNDAVRVALAHLTDEQQLVIELKFFEGLSNLEVAGIMGKTEGAIKSLQFRALAALRRCLEGD
jgi:RNA polymerase sigma-70 factor, ECF subfamily